MKIGLFGDGSLSLQVATRDGSVSDRRELFRGFEELGAEWVYLAPQRLSPNEPRCLGWDARPQLDLLLVETRRGSFVQGGNLDRNPGYQQWRLLTDWAAGKLGDCELGVIDFDMNMREVFGLGRKDGAYREVPGASEAAELVRQRATFLTPCEPSLLLDCGSATVRRWLWPYPVTEEADPLPREYDLTYAGSDYSRRARYWSYYVEAARHDWRVATAGSWSNQNTGGRKGAAHDQPFRGKNFRERVEAEGVNFVGDGKTIPYADLLSLLRSSASTVQIAPAQYERAGHYTSRMAQAAATGCVPFVDWHIAAHEHIVPDSFFVVSSFEDLSQKQEQLSGWEWDAVITWREHLREVVGDGVRAASEILRLTRTTI